MYLNILARYACDPEELGPEPEEDEEIDPAGDGGPTFKIPFTTYLVSLESVSMDRFFEKSCSSTFDIFSGRFGSGVDSRVVRLVRRRIEDEFSIFFLSQFYLLLNSKVVFLFFSLLFFFS